VQDRAQIVQILRDGCAHMRKAFDIESINLDDLIATALERPQGGGRRHQSFSRHQLRRSEHRLSSVL
jgi:hypothetical protein